MRYRETLILILLLTVFEVGCAICPTVEPQQELIMRFDNYMIPLAKAVDVVADSLPSDATSEAIFSAAVNRSGNPNLLRPFKGYILKARVEDGFGIILLCTPDGKKGIIEDVTCTSRPDTCRPSGSPCEYFLNVKRVCDAQ